jgi:hypothetical protein
MSVESNCVEYGVDQSLNLDDQTSHIWPIYTRRPLSLPLALTGSEEALRSWIVLYLAEWAEGWPNYVHWPKLV